jgi:type III restriction enzyme
VLEDGHRVWQEKREFEISWPNALRIDHEYRPRLTLDLPAVRPLLLDAAQNATLAELAPVVEGKPDVSKITEIDLTELGRRFRFQKIVFEAARDVFDQMKPNWKGAPETLLGQIVALMERFLSSDRIEIVPGLFNRDDLRRRIVLTLNMNKIVQHVWEAIRFENTEALAPVFDKERPVRSTGEMRTWFTGRPCERTLRSHINFCVYDSTWEASESFQLDRGVIRKYWPDFLIRLKNGRMLVLEVKGQDSAENQTKREFLDEWVRAVNAHGAFGRWSWAVSQSIGDLSDILERATQA